MFYTNIYIFKKLMVNLDVTNFNKNPFLTNKLLLHSFVCWSEVLVYMVRFKTYIISLLEGRGQVVTLFQIIYLKCDLASAL